MFAKYPNLIHVKGQEIWKKPLVPVVKYKNKEHKKQGILVFEYRTRAIITRG